MEKGIRTSIASRALVGAILLSAMALNPGAVCGQTEVVPEAEPKKKVEPVFRVSKFAKDNIKRETPKLTTDDAPKNRIASANSLPNFPATGKPETPVETPSVEASPKAVPAKPAKSSVTPKRAPHPLDRALEEANEALREMQSTVYDYTALMAKREQINGVVGAPSYMSGGFEFLGLAITYNRLWIIVFTLVVFAGLLAADTEGVAEMTGRQSPLP